MVRLIKRMRGLQARLLEIRLGSGAAIFPKEVKRIHLRFAPGLGGHMGARKFWHNEMVRLQYHNPSVSMTTDRSARVEDPATLSIHFAPASTLAQTGAGAADAETEPTLRVETIEMKHKKNSEILNELIGMTQAMVVEPTPADLEELAMVQEQAERSQRDAEMMNAVKEKQKREKQLLAEARQDA